jgi:protein TonB
MIPKKVEMLKENAVPPTLAAAGVVGGVPGGVPGGQLGGVIGGILNSVPKAIYVPRISVPKIVRVSQGVTTGLLVRRVQPTYPPLAREARIQGTVLLQAVIGKNGKIDDLQVVKGHPMLVAAALAAVKQWRYKPYLLNGAPVEVETQITVNFNLG